MRNPRDFFKPLAIGAPEPPHEIPFKPSRMIHFFDASNEKMRAKVPDMAKQADILLGNLEDAVPVDKKIPAREGLIEFDHPRLGTVRQVATPLRVGVESPPMTRAPLLGEHTVELLGAICGYGPEHIRDLVSAEVIALPGEPSEDSSKAA